MTDDQHEEFIGMRHAIKDLYRITGDQNKLLAKNTSKLDDIHDMMMKSKGGWLVLIILGSGLSVLIGWVASNWQHFSWK